MDGHSAKFQEQECRCCNVVVGNTEVVVSGSLVEF